MPAHVPTGTVLFVTTIAAGARCGAIASTTFQRAVRSAEPSALGGVPTARKTTSASAIAVAVSVVNRSRPARAFRSTSSSSPGS